MYEERLSQRCVPLTFTWRSISAVWAAWGKNWLWAQLCAWCSPDAMLRTLLGAPLPSTAPPASPPTAFTALLDLPPGLHFHQHFSLKGAANLAQIMHCSDAHCSPQAQCQQRVGHLSIPRALLALHLRAGKLGLLNRRALSFCLSHVWNAVDGKVSWWVLFS